MNRAEGSSASVWGPPRVESFRALWIAVLVANVGGWMQTPPSL